MGEFPTQTSTALPAVAAEPGELLPAAGYTYR